MASEGDLNHVALTSLNQTGDLMVSTLPNGFAVMDSFPRKLRFHRQGVGHLKAVKLKGTSNLVAFVKRDEPRSVVLFDQRRERPIGELTTSDTDNVDAFDWGDRIIATISRAGAVAVYDLSDLRLEHTFASAHAHADEVLAVNASTVAYPDAVIGSIRIYDSATATTKTIRAHEHAIACSCLSPDGKKLATASTKGTVIRIHSVPAGDRERAVELRRSSSPARVHAIAMSHDSPPSLLALASDSGTLHVFEIDSKQSPRLGMGLRSKWRVVLPSTEPSLVAFHAGTSRPLVTVVSRRGEWHMAYVVEDDGEMRRVDDFVGSAA